MLSVLTKLSMPQTRIAKTIPKAMAVTISIVLIPRIIPTSMLLSNTSLTKLMMGTPGTRNSVQAISGCQGVLVCRTCESNGGRLATKLEEAKVPSSQARMVATKAATAMLAYILEPISLSLTRSRKPSAAAIEA